MTALSAWTSRAVPSAILLPKSRTTALAEMAVTRFVWCSTPRTVSINPWLKLAVLLVEHHMSLVMAIADKVVGLDFGSKIAEGTAREVQADKAVIHDYHVADEED